MIVASALALGCGSKPSIVGTWSLGISGATDVTATFAEGGNLTLNATIESYKVGASGLYALDGDSLTLTVSKFDLPADIPAAFKSMAEAEAKRQLTLGASKIEWVGNDEIRVTPPAGGTTALAKPFTMTRKK
ncbi:MAG: hypothetical protein ABL949_15290 [Fimbriimonadaceae bacterium]